MQHARERRVRSHVAMQQGEGRRFAPRDYLGASPTRSGLASGQSATVAMDIVEPAPRIVAFTFDFR